MPRIIPTALHAAIDWAAVPAVELMGRCALLAPRVRRLLRTSARLHAGYAALTDYELGAGKLPMPAHLALDATIGIGLIGAGLLFRREPTPVRAMLVAMGLTELTLVALTERAPRRA
jgi:hypothetical protein